MTEDSVLLDELARNTAFELYKILTGKYDSDCGLNLYFRSDIVYASITRGNKFKLVPQHCKYDLTKTLLYQ